MNRFRDGTIKEASEIDFTNDWFKRTAEKNPGWYVFYGMWKGPFPSKDLAKEAYQEWRFEARYS